MGQWWRGIFPGEIWLPRSNHLFVREDVNAHVRNLLSSEMMIEIRGLMKRRVDGLGIKSGPTESGIGPRRTPGPVGGEIIPFDLLASLSKYWILLLILLLPLVLLMYKRREIALNLLSRFLFLF